MHFMQNFDAFKQYELRWPPSSLNLPLTRPIFSFEFLMGFFWLTGKNLVRGNRKERACSFCPTSDNTSNEEITALRGWVC